MRCTPVCSHRHTHAQTHKHSGGTVMERKWRLSRLVAVLPPPGTINVNSHLVTAWPSALTEDGWRSMDAERGERLCPRAKISNDSSPRFCKDTQSNTCTQGASIHTHTHTQWALLDSPSSFHLLMLIFLHLKTTFVLMMLTFFPSGMGR